MNVSSILFHSLQKQLFLAVYHGTIKAFDSAEYKCLELNGKIFTAVASISVASQVFHIMVQLDFIAFILFHITSFQR